MKKIRLLCLLTNMNGGGAERVMIHLLRALDRRRFDLTLGLAQNEGPFVPLIPEDVRVIDFGVRRSGLAVPALVRLFSSGAFDLCFSMVAMNLAATLAREISRSKLPLILGARNHYSLSLPAEATYAPAKAFAVKVLYPRAEMVIGVAQGVCDDLAASFHIPKAKLRAIYNPIDFELIRRAREAQPAHPWLAPNSDRPTIVNVGKLEIAKGQAGLIEAFRLVRKRVPARLLILGRGPLQTELQAHSRRLGVSEDVAFLGFQHNPYAFMARATVFVLSSFWEGFPNVLTEAMACGAAVVSNNCPSGPSEIVTDGENGLLVTTGDTTRLAGAIVDVLTNPELRRSLALRAEAGAQRFNADAIVRQYVDCFDEVLAKAAGGFVTSAPGVSAPLASPH